MRGIDLIAIHYEESLPSESPAMKESEDRGQATLERVEKMKFEALCRGQKLTFNPRHYLDEAAAHFHWWEFPSHGDIPRIRAKDLQPLELKE